MVKKMGNTTKALLKTYILYVLVYKFLAKKQKEKKITLNSIQKSSSKQQREEVKEENYFSTATSTQEHRTARMLTLPPVFVLYNYTIKFPETIFSVVKTSAHCISILN